MGSEGHGGADIREQMRNSGSGMKHVTVSVLRAFRHVKQGQQAIKGLAFDSSGKV